jgi:undecaprenyl-diphosphatase
VANAAAHYTNPPIQNSVRTATWAADEHLLGVITAAAWVLSRAGNPRQRAFANHLALTVAIAVVAPKIIKKVVNRTRPDRVVVGHDRRGVKKSGNPHDSFPSGHSVHVGAVVSALCWGFPYKASAFLAAGALVAATRIAVLAHWSTDVLIGLITGAVLEQGARRILSSESRRAITARQNAFFSVRRIPLSSRR